MLRIREAQPLTGRCVRLVLTDGSVIERDLRPLMRGPIFAPLLDDDAAFRDLRVEGGTVVWANGVDLCPDVLIWDGPPPEDSRRSPVATFPARPAQRGGARPGAGRPRRAARRNGPAMPSARHEIVVELLRTQPRLVPALVCRLRGRRAPGRATVGDASIQQVVAPARSADLVLELGDQTRRRARAGTARRCRAPRERQRRRAS
jgi:hypothetical protein